MLISSAPKNRWMQNGNVKIGIKIFFRKVEFVGLIGNVNTSVVSNMNAPLLLSQSVLSKYCKLLIDNEMIANSTSTMQTK